MIVNGSNSHVVFYSTSTGVTYRKKGSKMISWCVQS